MDPILGDGRPRAGWPLPADGRPAGAAVGGRLGGGGEPARDHGHRPRWWHLAEPSPELLAAEAAGALGEPGVAFDLGCGLGTEIGYLSGRGWRAAGVDLSAAALARARAGHPGARFARAAGWCCTRTMPAVLAILVRPALSAREQKAQHH